MNDYIIKISTANIDGKTFLTVTAQHKIAKSREIVLVRDMHVKKRVSRQRLLREIGNSLEEILNEI
jgi:hypothetical protein